MQRSFSKAKKQGDDRFDLMLTMPSAHSLDDIWGALTKPEKLAKWLGPVSGKLSKGGAYQIGSAVQGQISVCEPKRRLALTVVRAGIEQALDITFATEGKGRAKHSVIRLKISARQSDLPQASWLTTGPAALGIGWEIICLSLAQYLDDPKSARSDSFVMNLAKSDLGRDHAADAFAQWRAAAHAGGAGDAIMAGPVPPLLAYYTGLPAQ
jgi:uncharacterized protein YndB with AHSA1/START domain